MATLTEKISLTNLPPFHTTRLFRREKKQQREYYKVVFLTFEGQAPSDLFWARNRSIM